MAGVSLSTDKRAAVLEVKSAPCTDCGETFPPYVMDLDHVRGKKVASISLLVGRDGPSRGRRASVDMQLRSAPMEVLLEELAKCDPVCANCHRIRTHERGYAHR